MSGIIYWGLDRIVKRVVGMYMKLCIVTVYNSINSGSYWQAFSLGYKLNQLGHDVSYYKRNASEGSSNSKKSQLKKLVKMFIKFGLNSTVRYAKTIIEFNKSENRFMVVSDEKILDEIDCFILGSDTIWNVQSKYFMKNYETYFGKKFFPHRVIAYAASMANTTKEELEVIPEVVDIVNNWNEIGVRDLHTKEVIEQFTEKGISLVCDPTFLLDKDDYQRWVYKPFEKKYIFVYTFKEISQKEAKELLDFAKKNQLIIINGATPSKPYYCDKTIVNSPDTFLSYMYYAEYVITDTFHGTAFSINLNKNFAVLNRNKKKVNDLLQQLGQEDRLVTETTSIIKALETHVETEDKLKKIKQESIIFLKHAIGGKNEDNK